MPAIRVRAVVSPVFGAVSYVVSAGRDAVVVDAGAGVSRPLRALVASVGLHVHAVLLTHGHLDHTWDACGLADGFGVPCLVHDDDADQLADPFKALGDEAVDPAARAVASALEAELRASGRGRDAYRPPDRVERVATPGGVATLDLGELSLGLLHAPGHTPGSMLVRAVGDVEGDVVVSAPAPLSGVLLTGDVLFAGTIGRTDLPGGDGETMGATLRDVIADLDPRLLVLPGHGPATTLARELVTNPFLTP